MRVGLSRAHFPVTTLGPGRRVGLWFQGCSIRCPGCISRDTWEPAATTVEVRDLLNPLSKWVEHADGLTVSGGEPFEQPGALREIVTWWRQHSDTSVLIFTGRGLGEIATPLSTMEGLVDAVITGPFELTSSQTLALRGSDNQEIHALTPAGLQFHAYDRARTTEDRRLDVSVMPNGEVWFAGIPDRGMFQQLRHGLGAAGHSARTSDLPPTETPA